MHRRIDDRGRVAMLQRTGGGRRESSLHRILRLSPLAGGLVLLLAGCGTHVPVTGTHANTPNPVTDASTPSVGTGPGSGQSSNNGGGGGTVSISFPGLPIGNGNAQTTNGNDECIILQWRGDISHPGVVVNVTSVAVTGPFEVVSMAAASCTESPACAPSQFSSANNGGDTDCFAGVEYTGPAITDPDSPPAQGSLALVGELSCPGVGPATCQQYRHQVQAPGNSSVQIRFYGAPSGGTGSASTGSSPSTGTGSPGTGSSSTASPGPADTGPPSPGSP
jgi:hypothetical protein